MSIKKKIYTISFFVVMALLLISAGLFYQIKYPVKYQDTINFYSQKYNLDNKLVASLINEESSFDVNSVSKSGAVGLMQILPSTAEYIAGMLKEDYKTINLKNPTTNIKYGCFYLNYLRQKFSDEKTVLCAYNAGETVVLKWLSNEIYSKDGEKLDDIPYEVTNNYVNKIILGKKHYIKRI